MNLSIFIYNKVGSLGVGSQYVSLKKRVYSTTMCALRYPEKKLSRTSQLNIIKVAYSCIFQTSWDRIFHNRSRNLIEIGNSFSFLVSCKPTRVQRDSKCSECASFDNPSESNHESPPLL